MNKIGFSLLPVTTNSSNTEPPESADSQVAGRDDSFDSLLQRQCEEPTEKGEAVQSVESHDTPPQSDKGDDEEVLDAPAPAGLIVMYAPPVIVPLSIPYSMPEFESAITSSIGDSVVQDTPSVSPDNRPSFFRPTDNTGAAAFPTNIREVAALLKAGNAPLSETASKTPTIPTEMSVVFRNEPESAITNRGSKSANVAAEATSAVKSGLPIITATNTPATEEPAITDSRRYR